MRPWLITILFFLLPGQGFAAVKGILVLSSEADRQVSVGLSQRADYVVQTVTLISEKRDSVQRYKEIAEAKRYVLGELSQSTMLSVYEGPAYLSPAGKGFLSSRVTGGGPSRATVHVLLAITGGNQSIFEGARELHEAIKGLKPAGDIRLEQSSVRLAVESPEQYRGRLAEMIYEDAARMRERMGGKGRIVLTGLQSPVQVRQIDDTRVEMYLDYSLSVEVP